MSEIDQAFIPDEPSPTELVNQVTDKAHATVRSTQNIANAAFDRLADSVDSAREQFAPALEETAFRIRKEPLKAMLVSAAIGAALMGLLNAMSRSSRY